MFETKTMAAFIASRTDYDMVKQYVNKDDLSPHGVELLNLIDGYYSRDTAADEVDLELLRSAIDRRFKDIPRNRDRMRDYMEEVLAVKTSTVNVMTEVLENERAKAGTKLADALLRQDDAMIEEHMSEYASLKDAAVLTEDVEEEYTALSLDELATRFAEEGQWHLAPRALRDRIKGGLRPGHHVVLAARPERGKTLFCVNIAAGLLQQGAKVLYIGNEDPIPDLVLRLLANLTGWSEKQMFADREEAMRRAVGAGYENCTFAGLAPGTLYEIEALVRRHKPDVLMIDQMRNVRANTENNTQRLEVVAQELRNIGRRHECLVISVTQVGDSGRDKLVLNDGDIDGSNTGIPGACDVIVMIGSNDEFELRDLRHLTLAKNKRGGDHSSFTVRVDRELSRVSSDA